jgi:phospholipase A-2-activating protein
VRIEQVAFPGTPWSASALENGDLVVGCAQASTSREGHVYVLTRDAARAASPEVTIAFSTAMEPRPSAPGAPGGDAGAADFKITGPYVRRSEFQGSKDGAYGFFRCADGSTMACVWSSAEGAWADIGIVQDAGEAAASEARSDQPLSSQPEQSKKDYVCQVTMETSFGMQSLQLTFDEDDDPNTVASLFVTQHDISIDNFEQVRDFILEQKRRRGTSARPSALAASPYLHIPTKVYLDNLAIDFKKVVAKIYEFSALESAGFTANEKNELDSLLLVLEATSRYHASHLPRAGVQVLLEKIQQWPPNHAFPLLDLLRMLVLHPLGAETISLASKYDPVRFLIDLLSSIVANPQERPAILVGLRVLMNMFRVDAMRKLLEPLLSPLISLVDKGLGFPHATVQAASAFVLHNATHSVFQKLKHSKMQLLSEVSPVLSMLIPVLLSAARRCADMEGSYAVIASLGTVCLVLKESPYALRSALIGPTTGEELNSVLSSIHSRGDASTALTQLIQEVRNVISNGVF